MFVFGPRLLIPLFYISTQVDDNYAHLGLKNALIQGPFLFYRERRGEKKIKKASTSVYLLCVPGEAYIAAENTYTKKQFSFGLRIVQSYVRIWYNEEYTSFLQVI